MLIRTLLFCLCSHVSLFGLASACVLVPVALNVTIGVGVGFSEIGNRNMKPIYRSRE